MTSSVIFYSFVSFTEWRREEINVDRSKTESGGLVLIFRQRKVEFSTILVWIWIEQVFLDSWSHDDRGSRELAGNRARRPAKQPLLCFSDHWKCLIVEFSFSVSDSFWTIFNLLHISSDGMDLSNLCSEQVKNCRRLYCFAFHHKCEWMGVSPNRTTSFISYSTYSQ